MAVSRLPVANKGTPELWPLLSEIYACICACVWDLGSGIHLSMLVAPWVQL